VIGSAKRNDTFAVMRVDAPHKLLQRFYRLNGFHAPNENKINHR
jgi:hypothetical protein